jgi:hypothetical protein
MKKVISLALAFLFLSFNGRTQSCLPNGIVFKTQSEIDNFSINFPGCTVIEGGVSLNGTTIVNLNGLSGITAINFDLQLANVPNLTSLSGLENVTSIGRLQIYESGLTDLTGLQSLSSLQALEIGYAFSNNPSLTSLSGMPHVSSLQGVQISQTVLTTLHGLENITTVGGMDIHTNPNLISLDGLNNLVSVDNNLLIRFNPKLASLHGLHNITSVGGDLGIWSNPSLTTLADFENLNSIGAVSETEGMNIFNNGLLTECSIAAVCEHLVQRPSTSYINSNASGCNSNAEVGSQCLLETTETIGKPHISIFPNPNPGIFRIELPSTTVSDMSFQILNLTGQVVQMQDMQPGLSTQLVHADDLPAGLYFLQVVSNGRPLAVEKFVKQ